MADFKAEIYPNDPDHKNLTVDGLTGGHNKTPGNVGVCLSGGGSRALTAGMGQLRALSHLTTGNGKSLLHQTKAISTVSGGSWLGVTFGFQSKFSDEVFLNTYTEPGELSAKEIRELPEGNIGEQIGDDFSLVELALQALFYRIFSGTPADMLWQTVIAKHILAPYDLYAAGKHQAPTQAFTYDAQTLGQILDIDGQNKDLDSEKFCLLIDSVPRPYILCNTSMFVHDAEPKLHGYEYLAPVQCTPFFTGIVGNPGGTDANNFTPGGGGVTSFAFNSMLQSVSKPVVSIDETRAWSIMDIVGISSAAFAETMVNLFSDWQKEPNKLIEALLSRGSKALSHVRSNLENHEHSNALKWLEDLVKLGKGNKTIKFIAKKIAEHHLEEGELSFILQELTTDLVPKYRYWPITNIGSQPTASNLGEFADGGSLENTGIASLLSYSDIDNVVAFVNSATPMSPEGPLDTSPIVTTNETTKVITTEIVIDSQLPPLFGYQPEEDGQYVPYDGGSNISKDSAWGVHNQVFPEEAFSDFLTGLWEAADGSKAPAIYKQTLPVLANDWFGVPARASIECVWGYISPCSDWEDLLEKNVRKTVDKLDSFPNYRTADTELTAKQVNLLSNFSAWSVANDQNRDLYIDLYSTVGNLSQPE